MRLTARLSVFFGNAVEAAISLAVTPSNRPRLYRLTNSARDRPKCSSTQP
jgi:hypothetical protein